MRDDRMADQLLQRYRREHLEHPRVLGPCSKFWNDGCACSICLDANLAEQRGQVGSASVLMSSEQRAEMMRDPVTS